MPYEIFALSPSFIIDSNFLCKQNLTEPVESWFWPRYALKTEDEEEDGEEEEEEEEIEFEVSVLYHSIIVVCN